MKFTTKKIGPKEADALLLASKANRPLRKGRVQRYARDMLAGDWHVSPQPIVLNGDGRLVDGQHRLQAVVLSGLAQTFCIVSGAETAVVAALDNGLPRSLGDQLEHYVKDRRFIRLSGGVAYRSTLVAGIIAKIYSTYSHDKNPSVEMARRILRRYEEPFKTIMNDTCATHPLTRRSAVLTAFVIAEASCTTKKAHAALQQLYAKTQSGELISRGDPAYSLRGYLEVVSKPRRRLGSSEVVHRGAIDSQWVIQMKTLRVAQAQLTGEPITTLMPPRGNARELIDWFEPTEEVRKALKIKQQPAAESDEAEEESDGT